MKHLRFFSFSMILVLALVSVMSPATAALAEEGDEEGLEEEINYFCTDTEDQHPVAAGIAELYEVEYEDVMAMFCENMEMREGEEADAGFGFGQIMLAYSTFAQGAELEDLEGDFSLEGILGMREEGMGWGQIWQEMGLIGKPDDVGKPDGVGKPDHVGPPPWAGGKDKSEGKGQ